MSYDQILSWVYKVLIKNNLKKKIEEEAGGRVVVGFNCVVLWLMTRPIDERGAGISRMKHVRQGQRKNKEHGSWNKKEIREISSGGSGIPDCC